MNEKDKIRIEWKSRSVFDILITFIIGQKMPKYLCYNKTLNNKFLLYLEYFNDIVGKFSIYNEVAENIRLHYPMSSFAIYFKVIYCATTVDIFQKYFIGLEVSFLALYGITFGT